MLPPGLSTFPRIAKASTGCDRCSRTKQTKTWSKDPLSKGRAKMSACRHSTFVIPAVARPTFRLDLAGDRSPEGDSRARIFRSWCLFARQAQARATVPGLQRWAAYRSCHRRSPISLASRQLSDHARYHLTEPDPPTRAKDGSAVDTGGELRHDDRAHDAQCR